MALFGGMDKNTLIAEAASWKAKFEIVKEENTILRRQNGDLQSALICKEAPVAWNDIKADQYRDEFNREGFIKASEEEALVKDHLINIEGPLFLNAEDMCYNLMKQMNIDSTPESIHDNDES